LKFFLLIAVFAFSTLLVFDSVYGHGVGSETFPPVELNGKQVTLEVSSSQSDPEGQSLSDGSEYIPLEEGSIQRDPPFPEYHVSLLGGLSELLVYCASSLSAEKVPRMEIPHLLEIISEW